MDKKTQTSALMHGFSEGNTSFFTKRLLLILLVVVVAGLGTGYLLSRSGAANTVDKSGKVADKSEIQPGKKFGSSDTSTFSDTAEGVLKDGGIEDEGQYHLVRPGGESQNVYLTSSFVDLSQFIDRKVKVYGQTQKAQVAGWLMDVGIVEVLQ